MGRVRGQKIHTHHPIPKIMEFIESLVKKKDPWTKARPAITVLHHTFVALTKTSPKVFLGNWENSGDLQPSAPGSLWTAVIKVLGCSFSLQVPIKVTAKSILKNDMKDLKLRGKSLTFDPACISTETKTGHFLTGRVPRQPFAKRQCVQKQFTWMHQT